LADLPPVGCQGLAIVAVHQLDLELGIAVQLNHAGGASQDVSADAKHRTGGGEWQVVAQLSIAHRYSQRAM